MTTALAIAPIRITLPKGGEYTADRNADGTWNIRDVVVFVANEEFDEGWCRDAVKNAGLRRERDSYLAPAHVRHHDLANMDSAIEAAAVTPAGKTGFKDVRPFQYEGKTVAAVFADFLQVPPEVYADIKIGKLSYRSVEILSKAKREFTSCAFLDHEVPRYKLPLLTISQETFSDFFQDGAVFLFRAQGERFMDADKPADSVPPAKTGEGAPPRAGEGSGFDHKAFAESIVSGVTKAMKTMFDAYHSPGETPGTDGPHEPKKAGDAPAEQDAPKHETHKEDRPMPSYANKETPEETARFKALSERVERAEADSKLFRERFQKMADDKAKQDDVFKAVERLKRADQDVDEKYVGELRAFRDKSAEVLEAAVATRERYPQPKTPSWQDRPEGTRKSADPEAEKLAARFKAEGPERFEKFVSLRREYDEMPEAFKRGPYGISFKEHCEVHMDGVNGVTIDGASKS